MIHNAIEIDHLTIGYRSRVVASMLTASVPSDGLTCLLGTNGAGKSTLLRTVAGLQPPIGGEVRLLTPDGQLTPMPRITRRQLARTVAVVLTERVEVQGLSVTEVVAMGRMPYTGFLGRLDEADRLLVDQALQAVGMAGFARRGIDELSDGERQKVMIAKALAQQTSVVILDEPTAFLDYPSRVEVMKLLRRLAVSEHRAFLLSTHDLELAAAHADHLLMLDGGAGGGGAVLRPVSHDEVQAYIRSLV